MIRIIGPITGVPEPAPDVIEGAELYKMKDYPMLRTNVKNRVRKHDTLRRLARLACPSWAGTGRGGKAMAGGARALRAGGNRESLPRGIRRVFHWGKNKS